MKPKLLFAGAALVIALGAGGALLLSRSEFNPSPPVAGTTPAPPDERAKASVTAKAIAGDAAAQLQLGLWELAGALKPDEYARAAGWIRRAAEAGDTEAAFRLAGLYQAGRGFGRDDTNAVVWFRKAAEHQHVGAIFNLGMMAEEGRGSPRDTQAAAGFMRQAALMGDAYAQYNMGRRCQEGHGTTRDLPEALAWFELAEAGGVQGAALSRQGLARELGTAERKRAGEIMTELKRRIIAGGGGK